MVYAGKCTTLVFKRYKPSSWPFTIEQHMSSALAKDEATQHALHVRNLRAHEATNPNAALDLIVVVEPQHDNSAEELGRIFAEHRDDLKELMRVHGNVLFRGFDISREEFQSVVSKGFQSNRIWTVR